MNWKPLLQGYYNEKYVDNILYVTVPYCVGILSNAFWSLDCKYHGSYLKLDQGALLLEENINALII